MTKIQRGDVFLTRGTSFMSRAIRFFTRSIGESRTKVNHVGLIASGGSQREAVGIEALTTVKRHGLRRYIGKKTCVAIYRPKGLTEADINSVVVKAHSYVGMDYGYLKIGAHMIDWVLQGAYVARRLVRSDQYPICSWLVAYAYHEVGMDFGVDPGAASPDDIWDHIQRNPEQYELVHPLLPLK
jgi:hypothetical protein